jgi:RNA polymerase sigma-70 factor (ECF subfamily)
VTGEEAIITLRILEPTNEVFRILYKRYYARVCKFFRRMGMEGDIVQDLAQDTFVRLYECINQYRGDAQWSYLEALARNVAFNYMRSQRTAKRSGIVVSLDDESSHTLSIPSMHDPDMDLIRREQAERLRAAIDRLPSGMKSVAMLYIDGFTYDEIAKITKTSPAGVKSRLRDARLRLGSLLSEKLDLPGD